MAADGYFLVIIIDVLKLTDAKSSIKSINKLKLGKCQVSTIGIKYQK